MSTNTGIAWTDHTFNGWWGCQKVAQGCANCYAEVHAGRFYGRKIWGPAATTERRIMGDANWNAPLKWDRESREHFELHGIRRRVFAMSMADALEDHPALVEPRKRFVWLIENTPFLDWQILTKRPENHPMFGWGKRWPENAWLGASAATQDEVDRNLAHLLTAQAAIRFLSLEPIIERITMAKWIGCPCQKTLFRYHALNCPNGNLDANGDGLRKVDWVIAGGESEQRGRCRPCDIAWLDDLLEQCILAGCPFFLKQMGSQCFTDNAHRWSARFPPRVNMSMDDDVRAFIKFHDPKGANPAEWPEDLRVQEFPR